MRVDSKQIIVALLLIGAAFGVRAAYLESGTEPRQARDRVIDPVPQPPGEHLLTGLIQRVEVAAPYEYERLSIFPIVLTGIDRQRYVATLREAMDRGWIEIHERDRAVISELSLVNRGPHHVLAIAGELISGGKQNRIVQRDILLPPRPQRIIVPVFCIERDRWSSRSAAFRAFDAVAHPRLRKKAASGAAQDAIWQEVQAASRQLNVRSETEDYQAIYESSGVKRRANEVARRFRRFVPSRAVGMVAVSRGRIIGADLFSDPDLFARERDAICRSFALEYSTRWGRGESDGRKLRRHTRPPSIDMSGVRRFLQRVETARFSDVATPGAGRLDRVLGSLTGSVLSWRGRVVHAALYP